MGQESMDAFSRAGASSVLGWGGICFHVHLWFWQNSVSGCRTDSSGFLLAVREATLSSVPCLGGVPPQAAQHMEACFFKTNKGVMEALQDRCHAFMQCLCYPSILLPVLILPARSKSQAPATLTWKELHKPQLQKEQRR